MKYVPFTLIALMASCNYNEEYDSSFNYDPEIKIVTTITNSGGALGEETYNVYYIYNNKKNKFFEGSNPNYFKIAKIKQTIYIKFCDGSVSLIEPIFLEYPKNKLIHVGLDLDCIQHKDRH
ncbi:MAG: hypothetical protein K2Y03_10190 [Sphingomonas sp.]|nr:hypothetical protein [Sphingomonas sp.]